MRVRRAFVLALCTLLPFEGASAGTPALRADPSRLAPWTTRLRDAQADGPVVLRYGRAGGPGLTFIGAVHESDPESKTFQEIAGAAAAWKPHAVIVEGVPTSWGANAPKVVALAREPLDPAGMQPNGETVPAVRAALSAGAAVWGGEPDDGDVKRFALAHGVTSRDLLGFYVLRVVPQWLREHRISSTRDPALATMIDQQLERSRAELNLPASLMPDFAHWARWYAQTQRKPIAAGLAEDEAGPLADGRWPTNRVSELVGRARDAHLLALTARLLRQHGSVMIVYGASHALVARPALDIMLGKPCYLGESLDAARSCASNVRKETL